jgi:hypothetical protein
VTLFLEGDHITHAKPRSASGEADLVGELDGRDPLVCDGKIFDGSSRGKSYLVKGVHQILKYAHDYGQHTAYLVIYNITDKLLDLPTDGTPDAWPPYTELTGVRVYFIHVRVLPPTTTASKAGKATRVTLTHDELTNPDTT